MSQATLCEVFRSPRKEGMYLYVDRAVGLARVPDALLEAFGTPESALVLKLTEERRLARADASAVLSALASEGYYLQMPPGPAQAGIKAASTEGRGPQVPGEHNDHETERQE